MRAYPEQYVDQDRLETARRLMREGRSLQQAAITVGVMTRSLDLALWHTIGGTGPANTPMF